MLMNKVMLRASVSVVAILLLSSVASAASTDVTGADGTVEQICDGAFDGGQAGTSSDGSATDEGATDETATDEGVVAVDPEVDDSLAYTDYVQIPDDGIVYMMDDGVGDGTDGGVVAEAEEPTNFEPGAPETIRTNEEMVQDGDGFVVEDFGVIAQNSAPLQQNVARTSIDRDINVANAAKVPDLCDIAGPGLNWLCGKGGFANP